MIIKCQKTEFDVNEMDLVLYNGACYQLLSRKTNIGRDWSYPIIAKAKAEKMIKNGEMILKNKKVDGGMELYYYTFKGVH